MLLSFYFLFFNLMDLNYHNTLWRVFRRRAECIEVAEALHEHYGTYEELLTLLYRGQAHTLCRLGMEDETIWPRSARRRKRELKTPNNLRNK